MTADRIASMFAARLPEQGGWISVKQARWLYGVWAQEVLRDCPDARLGGAHKTADGYLSDGRDWHLAIAPNGAGALHFGRYAGRR